MSPSARSKLTSLIELLALFGFIAIFFGTFFTLCMVGFSYEGVRQSNWMIGEGRVESSYHRTEVRKPRQRERSPPPVRSSPEWVVNYSYEVDGKRHSGSTVMGSVGGWQVGSLLKVYYDPASPSRSLLIPPMDSGFYLEKAWIFAAVALVGLLLALPWLLRRKRPVRPLSGFTRDSASA